MMKYFKFKRSKWLMFVCGSILALFVYLLSYAPFLMYGGYAINYQNDESAFVHLGQFRRAPSFYWFAEWVMIRTDQYEVLAPWNEAFGAYSTVRAQLFMHVLDNAARRLEAADRSEKHSH